MLFTEIIFSGLPTSPRGHHHFYADVFCTASLKAERPFLGISGLRLLEYFTLAGYRQPQSVRLALIGITNSKYSNIPVCWHLYTSHNQAGIRRRNSLASPMCNEILSATSAASSLPNQLLKLIIYLQSVEPATFRQTQQPCKPQNNL